MSKFSNVEKYAIQNKIGNGETVEEVAAFLNRSAKDVSSYLGELEAAFSRLKKNEVPTLPVEVIVTEVEPVAEKVEDYVPELERQVRAEEEKPRTVSAVPEGLTKKLMVNKTAGKGDKGVSIMTPGAAAVSDDAAKEHRSGTRSRTSKGALYNLETKKVE
jgi:hypothetical protein